MSGVSGIRSSSSGLPSTRPVPPGGTTGACATCSPTGWPSGAPPTARLTWCWARAWRRRELHRRCHRPPCPRRRLAAVGDRRAPADQDRLPHRRRYHRPGYLRRRVARAPRRRMNHTTILNSTAITTPQYPPAGTDTVNRALTPKRPGRWPGTTPTPRSPTASWPPARELLARPVSRAGPP